MPFFSSLKTLNWSDLAGDEGEAWGDGGRRGEVAHGGEMGGGHQRAVWEQQKWSRLNIPLHASEAQNRIERCGQRGSKGP